MRRLDVEEFLGRVPMPQVDGGLYLIDLLFRIGPIKGEMPLNEGDLEPWERRRGIELAPWQAELIVDMSQAYLKHMHCAKQMSALSPWPKAMKMWQYVMEKKHAKQQAEQKEKEPDGNRKRRRNPPPG